MTEFGLFLAATDQGQPAVEFASLIEREGFDALFVGEHSHLPAVA
jgi:hypothetical protein